MSEIVFRYVVNMLLMTCRSDLGPFSPLQRPSLILNVGSVVLRPCQRFVEVPSPHFSAPHNPTRTKQPHYSHHKDEVFSLITVLVLSKLRQDETDRSVFSMVGI